MVQTELDDTKFCYKLIITITEFVRFQVFLKIKTQEIPQVFASEKNKSLLSVHMVVHTVPILIGMMCTVLLVLKSGQLIANQL